jgi:hypothetical protein
LGFRAGPASRALGQEDFCARELRREMKHTVAESVSRKMPG